MGQILLSVMLPKAVYWRCFSIQARSRSLFDTYRMGSCVFWYASSGLLGLSWKCQPEIYLLQQPVKSLWRMWSGIALGLSSFLGNYIQGVIVPPQDSSFGGVKRLHVAWNGGVGVHRAAVPFPLDDRHKVLSLSLVEEFDGQKSSPWNCVCAFPLVSSCRRRLNGL